ncbi:hypothetical protein CONPUDRAFT_168630 [Coniophora puteana RWD-64-598 SS2]|uniref:Nudix hydrolase domain-containing protein n=1 Tax=Coniophora puteana (strain RWD-64-598) TaxID=741705 RepID=A0A5M3MCF1_CONPW|nr:uncharacterized protein CONPUDRAFT_168630 [Coniophora puteana RWD-64-598 SS2]EIW76899.1 hypothetical protein CONPUDRAFT_168630 [Coniophora puteana RWD-64-598 SS2]
MASSDYAKNAHLVVTLGALAFATLCVATYGAPWRRPFPSKSRAKSKPGLPASQYSSTHFVVSAGAIAFAFSPATPSVPPSSASSSSSTSSPTSPTTSTSHLPLPKQEQKQKQRPTHVVLVHHARKDEWLFAKGRRDEREDPRDTAVREVREETGFRCRIRPVTMRTRATIPVPIPIPAPLHSPPSPAAPGPPRAGDDKGVMGRLASAASSSTSVLATAGTSPTVVGGVPLHQPDVPRVARDCVEPFSLTIRPQQGGSVKLVYWFIGEVIPDGVAPLLPGGADGGACSGSETSSDADGAKRRAMASHADAEGFGRAALFPIEEALERLTFEGDRELLKSAVRVLEEEESLD